jgi:hypothetical protein
MPNKPMFYIGMVFIAAATVLLLFNLIDSTFSVVLGFLGLIALGASNYRPMKK